MKSYIWNEYLFGKALVTGFTAIGHLYKSIEFVLIHDIIDI